MVEWTASPTEVHVPDDWGMPGKPDLTQLEGDISLLPGQGDRAVSGSARCLQVPANSQLFDSDGRISPLEVTELDDDRYLLRVDASPGPVLSFTGPAQLHRCGAQLELCFERNADVTIRPRNEPLWPPTIRVSPSPAGVAAAITAAGRTVGLTSPKRSHPSNRPHPPLIEFGDTHTQDGVPDEPVTNIGLELPAEYGALYHAAPLAYYLGAEVTIGSSQPTLQMRGSGTTHQFKRGGAFATEAANLLRRVFFLDCFARRTAAGGCPAPEQPLPFDIGRYSERSMADRLTTALAFPAVDTVLPEWHLSTAIEPAVEHARALPYLLDRLSTCHPPSASELDGQTLLKRTLDDFYGEHVTPQHRSGGEVATAKRLNPNLGDARLHAWLADGIPVSIAKTSTRAYENIREHGTRDCHGLEVHVVLNDAEMMEERPVAEIYQERAADLPLDVTIHESLTCDELSAVFESQTDLVHYVGHCELAGLECVDGSLSVAGLEVGTRAFFLNACGSFREGLALVEGGAGAGAVTLTRVLNDHAAIVGTAFARLLVNGFGIERALSMARRQVLMGQDYTVVGDPTYSFAPSEEASAVVHVAGGPQEFEVQYEVVTRRTAGRTYNDPFDRCRRLHGNDSQATLSRQSLASFLQAREVPVLYEGQLHWAPEFKRFLDC